MIKSTSFLLLLGALLAKANAAGIKGVHAPPPLPQKRQRALKKKKFSGPNARSCVFSSKKHEVEFECESRVGGSKDGSAKGGASKSASKDDGEDFDFADTEIDEDERMSRGISIVPEGLEIKDKIKYEVKTGKDGIKVKLEYKSEVETEQEETETKTKFELLFLSLIEYTKGDNADDSEAYDWESDTILQTIDLDNWDDISDVKSDDAGVVSYFTATTKQLGEDAGTGSATFNFTIARADQGEQITANSMKVDVQILDFPWMQTSDSYIALMSTFESKKKVKVKYEEEATVDTGRKAKKTTDITVSFGEDLEDTLGFNTYGEYTWAEDAEVREEKQEAADIDVVLSRQGGSNATETQEEDTTTISVVATTPTNSSTDTFQEIAYSFVGSAAQGAADIYWDPTTGIGYETDDTSDAPAGTSAPFGGMSSSGGAGVGGMSSVAGMSSAFRCMLLSTSGLIGVGSMLMAMW